MTDPTRRQLLFGGGASAAIVAARSLPLFAAEGTPVAGVKDSLVFESSGDEVDIPTTVEDRQFRRAFKKALIRLRMRGKVTRKQFREFRHASFSTLGYERNGRLRSFIQHVRGDVEEQAGGSLDDVFAAATLLIDAIVAFIVDNWNSLVKNLTANLQALTVEIE